MLLLSVVIPAYNEEDCIREAVEEIIRVVLPLAGQAGAECVVVDDGSRDATGALLDSMAEREPQLRVIHQPNQGHGAAWLTGVHAARGRALLLLDSDRQVPMEAVVAMWRAFSLGGGEAKAVLGVRAKRDDPYNRKAITFVLRSLLRLVFGVPLRDANAPCKLVTREVLDEALATMPKGCLTPSIFLALTAMRGQRAGRYTTLELPVGYRQRQTGTPLATLGSWRLYRFCAQSFFQLLSLVRRSNG